MNQEQWTAVEGYFTDLLIANDLVLEAALSDAAAAGLPPYSVSPCEGKLLMLLARLQQARHILEIGTLAGYSTIWLARALSSDGRLITLELEENHAAVARTNIARAGFENLVDIRVGPAIDTLQRLATNGDGPFDVVFIDADKQNNLAYFEWSLKLSRPGSLIITDNVVRGGAVIDASSQDPTIQGVRAFTESLAADSRVSATVIQTVGSKGYDGFAIAMVDSVNEGE